MNWLKDWIRFRFNISRNWKSTDDIWEVRARIGSNSFRILGFIDGDEFIILTNGFSKKSQKTPKKEIKLAEQRKADYLSRK
ncbi:type II toxin-antitoxin system RelE/ParE family toxin [Rhodohalobacter sp. SW132]|uniref:type II toxin-antitoxin system RelE/ParE family toxin n=1 Tax=Rhodohalobacter sp. SW132 TaxID=2293433 RepID=UPI0018F3CDC0|nr:type II toxin-antitoxin system RelE/ParE family toxin [Rhodohalobacter sp. SW132]